MKVRGSPAHSGGKDRNWKSIGLELKEKLYGWIAGEGIRLTVHQGKPSKVCIRAYKGKKTACEKCEQGKETSSLIFVPFYPEESSLRCVLHVHDDCEKALAALDLHDYFAAWRGNQPDVGVQLAKLDKQKKYTTPIATRYAGADISEWLTNFMSVRGILSADDLLRGAKFVSECGPVLAETTPEPGSEQMNARDDVKKTVAGLADQWYFRTAEDANGNFVRENVAPVPPPTKRPSSNGKH